MSDTRRFGQSLVMTRIGDHEYPLRSEPRCSTCMSAHRIWIESQLVRGISYARLAREVAQMPTEGRPAPSVESLKNHVKAGHLPLPQAVQRRIIERRAQEVGRSVEDGDEALADYVTLNQMVVQQGVEMMASGQMPLKASDVLAASRFLHDVERESVGDTDAQVWVEALMEYMRIALQFIAPEQRAAYGAALHASPVLRAAAERQRRTIEGSVAEPDTTE